MTEIIPITLAGIADGAAEELFRDAVRKVLDNLVDPNTDWKKPRRVTLTFDFSTDEERRIGDVDIACSAKLAGVKGINVGIYIGKHEGVLTAVEAPKQESLFSQPEGRPRAVVGGGQS